MQPFGLYSLRSVIAFLSVVSIIVLCIWIENASADLQQDWEKLVSAAEKEGEVTIYGQARSGVSKAIGAFSEAYPKIKINFVGGQGSDLSKKLLAERRAGKNLVDVTIGGGATLVTYHKVGALQPVAPALLLPEV